MAMSFSRAMVTDTLGLPIACPDACVSCRYLTHGLSSLGVIETSHSIRNSALYNKLSPDTVPAWIRVVVANALASSGDEWAQLFSAYHSGTYNNEWQVIGKQTQT